MNEYSFGFKDWKFKDHYSQKLVWIDMFFRDSYSFSLMYLFPIYKEEKQNIYIVFFSKILS